MSHQVLDRQPRDRAPLVRGDRFTRLSKRTSFPRLYFHEHHRLAVTGDDVQFSTATAVTPGNNCVPPPLEFFTSQIFAGVSERDACVGHETHARAKALPRTAHHEAAKSTKSTKKSCTRRPRDLRTLRVFVISRSFIARARPPSAPHRRSAPPYRPAPSSAPAAARSGSRSCPRRAAAVRAGTQR